jgi:hypothetical protein
MVFPAYLRSWESWETIYLAPFMRLACGLPIALWLGFLVAGMASVRQQSAVANSPGQAPAEEKKALESATKEKTDAGSASAGSASVTRKRHKPTTPAPDGGPRRVVVREGGASEPTAQIVPGMTLAEAASQRQNAERLLSSADERVKQLAERMPDLRQQETVGQIRDYMDGARSALNEGDVRRANTLALKAHLLAEDLAKH